MAAFFEADASAFDGPLFKFSINLAHVCDRCVDSSVVLSRPGGTSLEFIRTMEASHGFL